jgi:hypothetical protein
LDEMLSATIAERLRSRGHDVLAVVEDSTLVGLPDEEILAWAASVGRTLVTANVKDFVPLDHRYKALGRTHGGLLFVSTKTFPQDRRFVRALIRALDKVLNKETLQPDAVLFLQR